MFAKRGFSGVSVRDIASAVGVRESALYKHFKNKQDILDKISEVEGVTGADISTAVLKAAIDAINNTPQVITYELLDEVLKEILKAKKAVNDNFEISTRKVSEEYALSQINKGGKQDGINQ